jgi:hypothetical protein
LRDAVNGVGDKSARETVERAVVFSVAKSREHGIFLLERDAMRQRHNELALGPLHIDMILVQRDFHACRNWNWFASDT